MMNFFLKSFLVSLNLWSLAWLASCGREETSELNSNGPNIPWALWCKQAKLTECGAYTGGVPQKPWESGLNIAKTIVNSPSKIALGRVDIERPAVRNLFTVTGAEDILQIVTQIPWQNIGIGGGTLEMNNLGVKGQITINSLTFISMGKSRFTWRSPLVLDVEGVALSVPSGEQLNLLKIDLSNAGQLSFITNSKTITNIPVSFFALRKVLDANPSAVDVLIRAICDVVFEPGFNWRNAIHVILDSSNIAVIRQALNRPDSGVVLKLVDAALGNSKNLWIGGNLRKEVLSLELYSRVGCSMKFTNVPILGNVSANLTFDKTFGLATITRQQTKVMSQVYGVNTSLGKLESVTLDGSKIVLKIGGFSIPLDLSSQNTSGPEVSNIQCANATK